jgi:adenosine deaminase
VEAAPATGIVPALELCHGVIPSLSAHPIRRFFDLGMCISVNTDDPAMFGNSLPRELDQVAEVFHFNLRELKQLVCAAADGAWLSDLERKALRLRLENDPAWPDTDATSRPCRLSPHA